MPSVLCDGCGGNEHREASLTVLQRRGRSRGRGAAAAAAAAAEAAADEDEDEGRTAWNSSTPSPCCQLPLHSGTRRTLQFQGGRERLRERTPPLSPRQSMGEALNLPDSRDIWAKSRCLLEGSVSALVGVTRAKHVSKDMSWV